MQRRLIAGVLVLALTASATRAEAGAVGQVAGGIAGEIVGGLMKGIIIIVVTGLVVGGTIEVLTATATYKNARAATNREEPSGGWMGVGAVGGVANVALGGYVLAQSLPKTEQALCDTWRDTPDQGKVLEGSKPCLKTRPASTGGLIAGTLFLGFGVFALGTVGWALKNAPDRSSPGAASPGTMPATVGFMLPAMRF
jgi:hypothetical protein